MKVIGLTGGIGMGKSTVAAAFRRAGIPVFDADRAVHQLQAPGGLALGAIAANFPQTVTLDSSGRRTLDRAALRRLALARPQTLQVLERIMHPLVRAAEGRFLAVARRRRARAALLDIPLLLETGGASRVDLVVVVSAPPDVQVRRVAMRRRMERSEIEAVIARQMPDREKRRRADVVVRTGLSRHHSLRSVRRIISSLA